MELVISSQIKISFYSDYDFRWINDKFLFNEENDFYNRITICLKKKGYLLHSLDVFKKKRMHPDICIFFDMPKKRLSELINTNKTKSILLIREDVDIIKINFDFKKHKFFDSILTWKKSLVDNKKYFFIPCGISSEYKKKLLFNYEKRKLCTLINSNKSSNADGELYSYRLKIIKWFEKNRPEEFDLYGYGWDEFYLSFLSKRIFYTNKIPNLRPSYRGIVDDKIATLNKYKFSICFENNFKNKGNVTEKIIDCFQARMIPIYYGPPDQEEYIPKSCFIDFRSFKSIPSMYEYIVNLPREKYFEYLDNIDYFLKSKTFKEFFTFDKAMQTIYSNIDSLLNKK